MKAKHVHACASLLHGVVPDFLSLDLSRAFLQLKRPASFTSSRLLAWRRARMPVLPLKRAVLASQPRGPCADGTRRNAWLVLYKFTFAAWSHSDIHVTTRQGESLTQRLLRLKREREPGERISAATIADLRREYEPAHTPLKKLKVGWKALSSGSWSHVIRIIRRRSRERVQSSLLPKRALTLNLRP